MKEKFNLSVSYSDHSEGTLVPLIAKALGLKLSKNILQLIESSWTRYKASLNPTEFLEMIRSIRNTEKILGEYEKEHLGELKILKQ